MDRDDDVERLFSWIKTPDLHYREFAGEREVADAVATWPALRDAVPEPSPTDKRLEPEVSYDEELLPAERARHADRPAALFGHHEPPPPAYRPAARAVPPPEDAREVPWAAEPPRPAPTFVPREPAPPEPPHSPTIFAHREPASPEPTIFAEREAPPPERPTFAAPYQAPPPVAVPQRAPPPPPEPTRVQEPAADQQFRGFEETQPSPVLPAQPDPESTTRSLDAIFSRVAHPAPAPRDGRRQASAAPGLGPVFRRLR